MKLLVNKSNKKPYILWPYCEISSFKVEKILKGSLDLIPSPFMKIQVMGGKVCLICESKLSHP